MEGLNRKFIYFICAVSAMGGLLFGYDWVVIGGAKPFYETKGKSLEQLEEEFTDNESPIIERQQA